MATESASGESIESMDVDGVEEGNLGSFQAVNKLMHHVPYAENVGKEAELYHEKLRENLARSILSKNIQLAASNYTKSLQSYIHQYGFRFTKEQHLDYVQLYYELLTMEECPLTLVSLFCQTYCLLMKKPYLLTRADLTIPWRPLFETLTRWVYRRKYTLSASASKGLESQIKGVILTSNKYFDRNTLSEVLEAFKPLMCPSTSKMSHCLDMLKLFLPYFNGETVTEFNEFLEFLLGIYSTWNNNPTWEWNMLGVFGSSSWHMIGKFDWGPHLPVMYARIMKGLCLPVHFKGLQNTPVEQCIKSFDASSASRWIVGTLGNRPDAIKNLKNFLETVETYYNPLNMGRWSVPLATLLNELVSIFTTRLKRERYSIEGRYWWLDTPEDRKLTDTDIDEFVQMTSELVLDFYIDVSTGGMVLKNLACMRPQKIIPAVMEKYESMVDTVTEPKKYLITMRWVTIVLLPLVSVRQEEDGYDARGMVIPFALSLLPTITCNDMHKTLSSLGVIHGLFNLLPIVDCSSLADTLEDENERKVCSETSCLEDFSLQFLDSILALVESKTHENTRMADHRASNVGINIEDLSLEKVLWAVSNRFAVQSSTKIFKAAAKKVVGFAFTRILETDVSGRLYASILQAFAVARPDVIFPKLLPKLCSSIVAGITDDILDEEDLDKFLLFHILILSSVLETVGSELLIYKSQLESVIFALLKLNGKKPYTFASNLLQRLLNSLAYIYPLENRISEADFDDINYLSMKDWGLTMQKTDIHIKWHVPCREELEWAKDIFLQVFTQFSYKYEDIEKMAQKDETINKFLLKDLHILIAVLDGLQPLLPFWDNKPLKAFEDAQLDFKPLDYNFNLPTLEITVPGTGQNIKEKYFKMFSSIKRYLDKFKADDTEAYIQLIKGMDNLIFLNTESEKRIALPAAKNLRNHLQNVLNPKRKSTRGSFIARVFEFHLKRLRVSMTRTWSVSHMAIMDKMFELCVNRYAQVRIMAQARFCRMVDTVGSIITIEITPKLIEKLGHGVPHDEYKGTLYTMLGCKNSPLLNNSWPQLRKLWTALIQSPFSEKNSIIKCIEAIRRLLSQSFMFFPLEDHVSQKAMNYAKKISVQFESSSVQQLEKNQDKITFREMINDLLSSTESLTHWRQRVLCIHMLSVLIVEEIPMPRKMIEHFYDSLISSSIDVRTTALHSISWFSLLFKRKMNFFEVNTKTGLKFAEGESIHSVLQYKSNPEEEAVKCGKLEVRDTRGNRINKFHVHKIYYGYVALPPILKIKVPPKDFSDFSCQPDTTRVVLEVAHQYFTNENYVKKLIDLFSEEEKGQKNLRRQRTRLFATLTRNNGPESLKLVMEAIAPLARDKDQWKQRCAADIIAGILFGLKLWNDDDIVKCWAELLPILNECFDSVTQETLGYWSQIVTIPTSNRDPNMMRFFIELTKDRWASSLQTVETTSVNAFKNMNFFHSTVTNLHWRGAEVYHDIFGAVQKYFLETPIPYVNVRDQLGRLIGDIFEWAGEQPVTFETPVSPNFEPFVNLLLDTLRDLVPEAAKYMANEKDSEDNAATRKLLLRFKSVMELIISLCWDSETSVDPCLYRFIPLATHFESYDVDPEIKSLSGVTLSGFSRLLVLPKHINAMLEQLEIASTSTSWKSRLCVVEFLKVFALNNTNVFASNGRFSERIMKLVLTLLSDRKIEVRESASKILSGFLHSLIIQKPMELLEYFQRQAQAFSVKIKRAWKSTPRKSLSADEIDSGHSAILGLCAFVDTYPYDVPEFLPNVLVTLSTHLHDPQPIPTTLRRCLSDFRRTHHDNWAYHKTKFSEDQLYSLTDIFVSPCYYA